MVAAGLAGVATFGPARADVEVEVGGGDAGVGAGRWKEAGARDYGGRRWRRGRRRQAVGQGPRVWRLVAIHARSDDGGGADGDGEGSSASGFDGSMMGAAGSGARRGRGGGRWRGGSGCGG